MHEMIPRKIAGTVKIGEVEKKFVKDSMSCLDNINIEQRIKAVALKLKLTTPESILCLTGPVGALSLSDVSVLKSAVAQNIVPGPVTGLQLAQGDKSSLTFQRLSTGCEVLDQALKGGILSQGITEISGESASGKTQFCLQLCLTAQLPAENGGLSAGTIYICTEDAFPSKRLYQMIQNFNKKYARQLAFKGNLGDRIFVEHVADYEGLLDCVKKKVPVLLSSGAVKLVILDSVAAHFRSDYEGHEMIQRAKHINSLGAHLHQLSRKHNIPTICVNQVTSSMKTEGRQLIPSLGLAWSNQLTTRIMLARTNQTVRIRQDSVSTILETVVREMEIVFAPHLPSMTVPYVIDHGGMKGFKGTFS